jgi:hypothetical protein
MPALACGRTLVVLHERGWVAKDEFFYGITSLHELVEMVWLHGGVPKVDIYRSLKPISLWFEQQYTL